MAPWAEATVAAARISKGMNVLDVACGTGIAARCAARRSGPSGRVVGIDIDRGMLSVAQAASIAEGVSVDYQYGSASELPFSAESFDAVMCLQGVQYFPDPLRALQEFRRVLRGGSILVIVTWTEIQNCKGHWALVSALERRDIDASAARKPFALSNSKELQSLATEAGFKDVTLRSEQQLGCFPSSEAFVEAMARGAPSTRHALEKVPSNDWPSFLADVEQTLGQWSDGESIRFPMESSVLVAYR